MHTRLALYRIARRHGLDPDGSGRLIDLAGLRAEPSGLARWLPRGLAVLAAALGGLGLVCWIAANWGALPRFGQFALLQGLVAATALGAAFAPAGRSALGLLALLGIGGLFAFFGQTYQTGADAWTLFAWWAVLGLPLCLGLRSDVLWAPWSLVAMLALSLWIVAHTGHRWRVAEDAAPVYAAGWGAALAIVAALSAPLRRWTGAGAWGLRTAATSALCMIGATALGGLFASRVQATYWLGLGLVIAAALLASRPRAFDVFVASAIALALCTLLVGGMARLLFSGGEDTIAALATIGLGAALLLAGAVKLILSLQRAQAAGAAP